MSRKILVLITLTLTMLFAACGQNEDKITLDDTTAIDTETEAVTKEVTKIAQYGSVTKVETEKEYTTIGSFVADEEVVVSPKVAGNIEDLKIGEGDTVRKGMLIAVLDQEEMILTVKNAKAQLSVADASLNNARSEFKRKEKLYKDGAISESIYDQVKTGLELAEAQKNSAEVAVEMAEKAYKDTKVISTASGTVVSKYASQGEFIDSGSPLVAISKTNPIKLTLSLPQRLAPMIVHGAKVDVSLSAHPGKLFTGEVSLINPQVDARTRTVTIEAKFDNRDKLIKPGYFAECTIALVNEMTVFRVPNNSLFEVDGGYELKVKDGNDHVILPVSLLKRLGKNSEISGDLNGDEQVLLQN